MKKSLYWAAGALVAGLTFAGAASANSLPASGATSLTQDLSARCRVVITRTWRHGHRVTIRRTVCDHRRWRHHHW